MARVMAYGLERLTLFRGDITRIEADAVVNAANSSLLGGGGVATAPPVLSCWPSDGRWAAARSARPG